MHKSLILVLLQDNIIQGSIKLDVLICLKNWHDDIIFVILFLGISLGERRMNQVRLLIKFEWMYLRHDVWLQDKLLFLLILPDVIWHEDIGQEELLFVKHNDRELTKPELLCCEMVYVNLKILFGRSQFRDQ